MSVQLDFEDEGDDEEEDDYNDDDEEYLDTDIDEIDFPHQTQQHPRKQRGYTKLLVTFDRSTGGRSSAAGNRYKTNLSLTDFEADSESSDLETIQQRIRNQRATTANVGCGGSGKGLLTTTYKYLIANGSFSQNQAKRYALSNTITKSATAKTSTLACGTGTGTDTDANGEAVLKPAIENNTTELESCEIHAMKTKATDLLVNATTMVANDRLHLAHQQQQLKVLHQQQLQLHNHQRLTLMAITQNGMTTGSAATNSSSSSGSSSSSSSSGALSGCSINGSNSNSSSTNGIVVDTAMQHKLSTSSAASDNNIGNQQHHQQNNLANGGGGCGVGIAGIGGTSSGLTMKQKNIAIISPNNSHNGTKASHLHHHHQHHKLNNKSPTVLRKHYEHHHAADISKFNRSNRKSKNCAIFYFKHLDTDNETNYSNSNCGDDVHDVVVGGGGGGGVVREDDDMANHDEDDNGNIVVGGGRCRRGGAALSSSAASSHASDVSSGCCSRRRKDGKRRVVL